jgi:hypothetical protein
MTCFYSSYWNHDQSVSWWNVYLLQGAEMPKIRVSVSVDDAHLAQILEVVKRLQSAGLEVEQTLPSVGVISGLIDADRVNSLYQITGVQQIESERSYQLPPPDAEIQ